MAPRPFQALCHHLNIISPTPTHTDTINSINSKLSSNKLRTSLHNRHTHPTHPPCIVNKMPHEFRHKHRHRLWLKHKRKRKHRLHMHTRRPILASRCQVPLTVDLAIQHSISIPDDRTDMFSMNYFCCRCTLAISFVLLIATCQLVQT